MDTYPGVIKFVDFVELWDDEFYSLVKPTMHPHDGVGVYQGWYAITCKHCNEVIY